MPPEDSHPPPSANRTTPIIEESHDTRAAEIKRKIEEKK